MPDLHLFHRIDLQLRVGDANNGSKIEINITIRSIEKYKDTYVRWSYPYPGLTSFVSHFTKSNIFAEFVTCFYNIYFKYISAILIFNRNINRQN